MPAISAAPPAVPTSDDLPPDSNAVRLVGRLTSVDAVRSLPSGDQLLAFRVVVRRTGRLRPRGATVDVIDCQVTSAKLRRAVAGLNLGTRVEIDGALRRRFYRAGGAMGSRYAVEVTEVRRAPR